MSGAKVGDLLHPDLTPDWCDPIAVTRCLNSQPVGRPLHHAERITVARTAHRNGMSTNAIGRLIGCSADQATRYLKEATCSD